VTLNGRDDDTVAQVIPTATGPNGRSAQQVRPGQGRRDALRPESGRPEPMRPAQPRADNATAQTEQLRRPPMGPDAGVGEVRGERPTFQPPPAREPARPVERPQVPRNRVRRARLRAVRLDPWSVMKTAFLLSVAFGIMTMIAVLVVWNVLDAAGVYDSVNKTVNDVLQSPSAEPFDLMKYIGLERVLGIMSLIAVVDVVLITALSTLGAFLYNLSASLLGGVEVTLAEED
jgi:hypothetical protein